MARSKRAIKKAREGKHELHKRQTYAKMFERTSERVYRQCYGFTQNRSDADTVFRDAFVLMYENIGSLRKSASLDNWQRQWTQKAFRGLIRTGLLSLIKDEEPEDVNDIVLDDDKKGDLWNLVTKMAEIDPWRMVPTPGRSSLISVLADQTMSDMRYMSPGDYVKFGGTVLAAIVILVVGVQYGIKFIQNRRSIPIEPPGEIFLDESIYSGEDGLNGQSADRDIINGIINSAVRTTTTKKGYDGNSRRYGDQGSIGRSAGKPGTTGSLILDFHLQTIVRDVTGGKTNDYEVLESLYDYLGSDMTYSSIERDFDKFDLSDKKNIQKLVYTWMNDKSGDSAVYSATLAALCQVAGYRCDTVKGYFVFNLGTNFERHMPRYWNRISINGTDYYMDLEADSNSDGTEVRRYYFLAASGNPRWKVYNRDHKPAKVYAFDRKD